MSGHSIESAWWEVGSMAFAASGLLLHPYWTWPRCTSGLPVKLEHSLRQRSECLLYLPAGFPSGLEPVRLSTCCIELRKSTCPLQLKFFDSRHILPASPCLTPLAREACPTRLRGHSFLRKADFSSRGICQPWRMSCETDCRRLASVAIRIRNACLPISITVRSCDMTVVWLVLIRSNLATNFSPPLGCPCIVFVGPPGLAPSINLS